MGERVPGPEPMARSGRDQLGDSSHPAGAAGRGLVTRALAPRLTRLLLFVPPSRWSQHDHGVNLWEGSCLTFEEGQPVHPGMFTSEMIQVDLLPSDEQAQGVFAVRRFQDLVSRRL